MKGLYVGDLHLNSKEIRSTKRMVDNNVVMLEGIYDFLVDNEDIKFVVFLGDIQHRTPAGKNTLAETAKWRNHFKRIGELMADRYPFEDIKILEELEDGQEPTVERIRSGQVYPLFTLKGNHDEDNEESYTFYDDAVSEGLLYNPRGIVVEGKTQINFFNYGYADDVRKKERGVEQVIGLYHDVIATEESPFWLGKHKSYQVEEILNGVDLGIIGHIHTNSDPIYVDTESGESVAWTLGSMGRTSFSDGQIRDYGYCGLVDTDDLNELGTVEIEQIKSTEYFNMKAELKSREKKKEYADFAIKIDEGYMRQHNDPREDIRTIEWLDDDVRPVCLEILDEVMEG